MIINISINRAITITGVSSLVIGMLLLVASPSFASTEGDSGNVSSPSRRKPGASRVDPSALSEVSSPSRRKPGSSRQDDVVSSPLRRKPGSTREDEVVILPLRRTPGSTREDEVVLSPLRRKPGSTRLDIALLLQENKDKRRSYHCNSDVYQLTALIPENLQVKTAQATPTLYFDLPSLPTGVKLEFVLQNQHKQVLYAATLQDSSQPGIMAIKIPPSQSLQANQTYHWYLSVVCDASRRERDLVVEGIIERVELDAAIRQSLISASPTEKVRLYQEQGLWQDALETVVTTYQGSRNEAFILLWQSLLRDINLDGLEEAMTNKSFFGTELQPLSFNRL